MDTGEEVGESAGQRQGAHQVDMHMTEGSSRDVDLLHWGPVMAMVLRGWALKARLGPCSDIMLHAMPDEMFTK